MVDIAIDFECYEQKEDGFYYPTLDTHKAVLGCVLIEGLKKPFFFDIRKGVKELLGFLIERIDKEAKRKRPVNIWAFNMNYDFTVISRDNLENTELFKTISYKPFITMLNTEKGNFGRLLDLMSFYPKIKLEEVGRIIGLEKKDMPKKVWRTEELEDYCKRDCEIVLKAVEKLKISLNQLGYYPKKLSSAPRLAYQYFMNICENKFYCKKCKKTLNKNEIDTNVFKREDKKPLELNYCKTCKEKVFSFYSYFWNKGMIHQTKEPETIHMASRGGRIEQFTLSKEIFQHVYKLDINSEYPFVCSHYPFPDILTEKTIEKPNTEDLKSLGITEATLKAPVTFLPYLPIRYNKVIYPSGAIIRGFWTNFEIREATEKYGYEIIDLHKMIKYKELPFNIFKPYFEKLYELKKNDENMKYISKLLMNSLTGRFEYKTSKKDKKSINRREIENYITKGYAVTIDQEGTANVIVEKEIEKKHYSKTSNPVIYAHITAYARDMLYKHMIKIPQEDLLYCVTDAIIFKNKENLKHFKIGTDMGEWKIEAEDQEAEFFNEHYYRLGNEIKASGARKMDVTIEALRGESKLITKQMITPKMVWSKHNEYAGQFEKTGSFIDKEMKLKRQPKRSLPYPDYIEEIPKSRMINLFNEMITQIPQETHVN